MLLATKGVAHSLTVDPDRLALKMARLFAVDLRVAYSVVYPVTSSCIIKISVIWKVELLLSLMDMTYLPPLKVDPLNESTMSAAEVEAVTELEPIVLSGKLMVLDRETGPDTPTELEKLVLLTTVVLHCRVKT